MKEKLIEIPIREIAGNLDILRKYGILYAQVMQFLIINLKIKDIAKFDVKVSNSFLETDCL